jgi:hypothetical protein
MAVEIERCKNIVYVQKSFENRTTYHVPIFIKYDTERNEHRNSHVKCVKCFVHTCEILSRADFCTTHAKCESFCHVTSHVTSCIARPQVFLHPRCSCARDKRHSSERSRNRGRAFHQRKTAAFSAWPLRRYLHVPSCPVAVVAAAAAPWFA